MKAKDSMSKLNPLSIWEFYLRIFFFYVLCRIRCSIPKKQLRLLNYTSLSIFLEALMSLCQDKLDNSVHKLDDHFYN